MKLTMFGAMGLGLILAALFLAWMELDLTFRGLGTFRDVAPFTLFSLIAILVFALMVARAPDNN